jgi:hypothetical protein
MNVVFGDRTEMCFGKVFLLVLREIVQKIRSEERETKDQSSGEQKNFHFAKKKKNFTPPNTPHPNSKPIPRSHLPNRNAFMSLRRRKKTL